MSHAQFRRLRCDQRFELIPVILVIRKRLVHLGAGQFGERGNNCVHRAPGANHGNDVVNSNPSAFDDGVARPHACTAYDVPVACRNHWPKLWPAGTRRNHGAGSDDASSLGIRPFGHKNAPHPQSEVKGKPDALGAGRGFRQTQKDPGKFRNTRGREQDLSEYPQPVLRDSWKCVGIHP